MKNKNLIETLKQYSEDIEVCILDFLTNLNEDFGDGTSAGVYPNFDVEPISKEEVTDNSENFIALSFNNLYDTSIMKPHLDYDFNDGDKVYIENDNNEFQYYVLSYEKQLYSWILIPYEDETFTKIKTESTDVVKPVFLYEIGLDTLNKV